MTREGIPRPIRIGTRGSALAMAQARLVAAALDELGRPWEIVTIETEGDRRAPDTPWGEGAFVKSIERALLDGRADIAVHSAKDVPTDEDPRLVISAYLRREDPLDVLVVRLPHDERNSMTLDELPPGSCIGTDSPRRSGFLRAQRGDLVIRPLHGNVDTRLRRLDDGEVDALVLAAAGLLRLGYADRISQRIPARAVPPAPGQGAIAIQVRADDAEQRDLGRRLDDAPTRLAVETERAFLRATGGGCRAPVGALAVVSDGWVRLLGGFATADGRLAELDEIDGRADAARSLAEELATRLTHARAARLGGPLALLTRPAQQSTRLAARLAELGVAAVSVPAITIEPVGPDGLLDEALRRLGGYDWVVLTSVNGARAVAEAARRVGADLKTARWAAVGTATAAELRAAGAASVWLPDVATAEALARQLPVRAGDSLLVARGSLADEALPEILRARGGRVDAVVAYQTREAPPEARPMLEQALSASRVDAVVLASPSAARGLLTLAGDQWRAAVLRLPAVSIGATTAAAARELGFDVVAVADGHDPSALAELVAATLSKRYAQVPA